MSILIVVVLPAPFGPSRPNSSPGRTSKLMPRTAVSRGPAAEDPDVGPVGAHEIDRLDGGLVVRAGAASGMAVRGAVVVIGPRILSGQVS